jgi:hypothetical protein
VREDEDTDLDISDGVLETKNRSLTKRAEQAPGSQVSDRLLSNRSDKNGSRKRTIFCRELSDHLQRQGHRLN